MDREFVDLYTLQRDMKEGLEDLFPDRIWVRAEIASLSVKGGGHCYLELVQSERGAVVAKVRAIIWRSLYTLLSAKFRSATGSDISAGAQVLVRAMVNFHEVYGLSLVIDDIDTAFTVGEQQLKRQQTIDRLTKEGLIDRQKSLRLTDLPYYLAVISAEGAAGLGDFRRQLLQNPEGYAYRVDLFPALMQGEGAPESIMAALADVRDAGIRYDAVLVLRGGGSEVDLSCFDDYALAAAIARFPLPVMTAIGHDKDFHVADMVACEYVKTPTALADMFLDLTAAADERISAYENRLNTAFRSRLAALESRIELAAKGIQSGVRQRLGTAEFSAERLMQRISGGAARKADGIAARLDMLEKGIRSGVRAMAAAAEAKVAMLEQKIAATDPRNVLRRGFSLALDSRGVKLACASGTRPGDKVSVLFADGRIAATVEDVELRGAAG